MAQRVSNTDINIGTVLLILVKTGVALVLLTPLIVMAPPLPNTFFPFIVGKALYARTLTEIVFGLWLVLALRNPAYRMPRSWLLVIFAVFVSLTLLSSLFGVSPQRSLWSTYERMQGAVDLLHLLAYTVVLTSVFRTWDDWRLLLNINLGIGFFMGLLGLAQYFEVDIGLVYLEATQRLDITLGNPTYVGTYMLVNVLTALGLLAQSLLRHDRQEQTGIADRRRARARRRRTARQEGIPSETLLRAFWMAAALLSFWNLYLSGSRGAAIGLAAGLGALAIGYILWGRIRRLRIASMGLIGFLVGIVVILAVLSVTQVLEKNFGQDSMLSRIANIGLNDTALKGRLNSWRVGLKGFVERPVLGWGPENWTVAYDRHLTAEIAAQSIVSFDQAHNKLIEELITKGILGYAAYVLIWLYMVAVIIRRVREQDARAQLFTLFIGAALTGYFVQNLFLFDTPGTVYQFILPLGFIVYIDKTSEVVGAQTPWVRDSKPDSGVAEIERGTLLSSSISLTVALVAVSTVVVVAIILLNYRPFAASEAVIKTLDPSITLTQRLDVYDESISTFQPLANYPRKVMFEQLMQLWDGLSEGEKRAAAAAADREGREAIRTEPEEWRNYLPLALLYYRVATIDPAYIQRARELVNTAAELAPERIEINQALVLQLVHERKFDAAQEAIDSYLVRNPGAARHFEALRGEIANVLGE